MTVEGIVLMEPVFQVFKNNKEILIAKIMELYVYC